MGQQQLLLVILVTIIVGIATVVAINTFSSAADSANLDAVRQDVATIASAAQGYYMKPEMLGGGGNDFTDLSFKSMAFAGDTASDTKAMNENGVYSLAITASKVTVTAYPASRITDSPVTLTSTATDPLTAEITKGNLDWTDNN